MYCGRCNIDFPEGLRYCKWCGQPLVDHPRNTNELQSCPACAAAVQRSWVFCKACGVKLTAPAPSPAVRTCPHCRAEVVPTASRCLRCGENLTRPAPPTGTAIIATCGSCGEQVETGSLYCKGCGSRVGEPAVPFGASSLLCPACSSYSPVGSTVCRVCGAPLGDASSVDAPRVVAHQKQQKPGTLPDLAQRLPEEAAPDLLIDSSEHTAIIDVSPSHPLAPTEQITEIIGQGGAESGAETSVLPGVAGSEQQTSTSVFKKTRITNPVEGAEVPTAPAASDELPEGFITADQIASDEAAAGTLELGTSAEPGASEDATASFGTQETPMLDRAAQTRFDGVVFDSEPSYARGQPQPPIEASYPSGPFGGQPAGAPLVADHHQEVAPGTAVRPTHALEQPSGAVAPKRRSALVIVGPVVAVVVVAALAGVLYWQISSRKNPTQATRIEPATERVEPTPAATPSVTPADTTTASGVPDDMVRVPAGRYVIGRDDGDPLERPAHEIEMAPFYIDRTEVTNAAYKKFVDATGHKPPPDWKDGSYPQGKDNFPVVLVSWQDAADYAKWAGKRLPTEAEWEAAARGIQAFNYPWGNEWRSGMANIETRGITEVGRYKNGMSPVGAADMIGNVWEWTADEFRLYAGADEAMLAGLEMKPGVTYRVMRGGAYDGGKKHDASYRGLLDGSEGYPKVGFRLVKGAR